MAEIIRSGAFLQQCWSVHPLCLTVKRVEPERIVVLTCSCGRMVHRVTTGAITRQVSTGDSSSPEPDPAQPDGLAALKTCMGTMLPPCRFGRWMCFKMRCGFAVRNVGRSTT